MMDVSPSAPFSPDSSAQSSLVSPPPFSRETHKAFDFVAYEFKNQKRKDPDKTIPAVSLAISYADKIHNIQSLIMALERNHGNPGAVWRNMKATPEQQLKSFREHDRRLSERWSQPILDTLESVTNILADDVNQPAPVLR